MCFDIKCAKLWCRTVLDKNFSAYYSFYSIKLHDHLSVSTIVARDSVVRPCRHLMSCNEPVAEALIQLPDSSTCYSYCSDARARALTRPRRAITTPRVAESVAAAAAAARRPSVNSGGRRRPHVDDRSRDTAITTPRRAPGIRMSSAAAH